MARLSVVITLLLILVTQPPQISPLAAVVDIAAALGETADVVIKFAESLGKGPGAGVRAYDLVAGRRAADRLREIGRQTAMLSVEQPVALIAPLERYVKERWRAFECEVLWLEQRLHDSYLGVLAN
jgi:hypothetical protein